MSESNGVGTGQDRDVTGDPQPPATPRWVKVSGLVVGLLVLAVLVKVLFGGGVGGHGPGLHGGLGSNPATLSAPAVAGPALLTS